MYFKTKRMSVKIRTSEMEDDSSLVPCPCSSISSSQSSSPLVINASNQPQVSPKLHPPLTKSVVFRGTRKPPSKPFPSSSSSPLRQQRRGRVFLRRRVSFGLRGCRRGGDLHDLALPLGMSLAAVVAQVLCRKSAVTGRNSADHLFAICRCAVKESIESVFGDRFDTFVRNFETSFGSTLKTLLLLNEASLDEQTNSRGHISEQPASSGTSRGKGHISEQPASPGTSHVGHISVESLASGISRHNSEDPPASDANKLPDHVEVVHETIQSSPMNHQIILHSELNQQVADVSSGTFDSEHSRSIISTFERSVMEQAHSNDLKAFEITLAMKKLKLKELQLALNSDANFLERLKISMGFSKASFKEAKLKTQMQEAQHAELLKTCIDCLVSGLLIMSVCLLYGAYIYSYERISEATISCTSIPKVSKSWWLPSSVSSFSSGMHMLRCHVVVVSRFLFGVLMILALAYSLLQRSASTKQTMPITFILLLLGVACGFTGKLCVDTLGGNGYIWLLYWEAFCLLHFFANFFISNLFHVLHGPICVSQGPRDVWFSYRIRRVMFYSTALVFFPASCGLLPFASHREWAEHLSSHTAEKLLNCFGGET